MSAERAGWGIRKHRSAAQAKAANGTAAAQAKAAHRRRLLFSCRRSVLCKRVGGETPAAGRHGCCLWGLRCGGGRGGVSGAAGSWWRQRASAGAARCIGASAAVLPWQRPAIGRNCPLPLKGCQQGPGRKREQWASVPASAVHLAPPDHLLPAPTLTLLRFEADPACQGAPQRTRDGSHSWPAACSAPRGLLAAPGGCDMLHAPCCCVRDPLGLD